MQGTFMRSSKLLPLFTQMNHPTLLAEEALVTGTSLTVWWENIHQSCCYSTCVFLVCSIEWGHRLPCQLTTFMAEFAHMSWLWFRFCDVLHSINVIIRNACRIHSLLCRWSSWMTLKEKKTNLDMAYAKPSALSVIYQKSSLLIRTFIYV